MTTETEKNNLRSMTGFASADGTFEDWTWSLEMRGVNGKALDLRLRVPDWVEGLEAAMRGQIAKVVKRGNVTISLRLSRKDAAAPLVLNADALAAVLQALTTIEAEASAAGMPLAPTNAADVAQIRGVLDQAVDTSTETMGLRKAILGNLESVLQSFEDMRRGEGLALRGILEGQLAEVSDLTSKAEGHLAARQDQVAQTLRANLQKVLDGVTGVDEDRLAQELALIAVKSDVTEEIDRLRAHVQAAHELLGAGGTVGRKLDFLMQEFNREANTLCSKSQNTELTRIGLALKAVIDQMREQVQNVE